MRLLIAPDKFKGSLSALAAAEAIERGFRSVFADAVVDIAPIADGGEGFAEALAAALGAQWIQLASEDANGRAITARYAWLESEHLAVIEMSEASGLWRIQPEDRDPLLASTHGTGILLRDAIARGARKILIGLGGSATTDGGAIAATNGTIARSRFTRNTAGEHGGAVTLWSPNSDNLQQLRGNTFTRNQAGAGGAITLGSCGPAVSRSQVRSVERGNRFSANRATEQRRTNNIESETGYCGD